MRSACDWRELGDGVVCARCGWQAMAAFEQECKPLNLTSPALPEPVRLTDAELAELFPDPTLIGNRLAKLTTALGIPPCGGCGQRQVWLNDAHLWLRDQLT